MQDRSFSSFGASGSPNGNNPAASIPLSVYRQQTAEMEQLKAQLATIEGDNRVLRQQNQDLIAAIEKFVSSAVELGESTSTLPITTPPPRPVTAPMPKTSAIASNQEQLFGDPMDLSTGNSPNPLPDLNAVGDLMIDPSLSAPSAVTVDSDGPSVLESNRWLSLLGIVVIAAIAFGISFALVGVFKPNDRSTPANTQSEEAIPAPPPPAEQPAPPQS
ncbi:MAG: hypothetical protein ACFCA4_09510 [Cyanophyceae cyanobacterium]